MRTVVITTLVAGLVSLMLGLSGLTAPVAEGAPCEHRSAAHIAEHGGLKDDSAWHVAHGGLPTCGGEEESRPAPAAASKSEPDKDRDKKSRFCRKRWWC
ncbi:hypothetical protein SEA_BUD_79 [Mycobacterium phage Bud]|nr:hypothetical protein SEA_BUD_79 [Mycobacterium phage Bud]